MAGARQPFRSDSHGPARAASRRANHPKSHRYRRLPIQDLAKLLLQMDRGTNTPTVLKGDKRRTFYWFNRLEKHRFSRPLNHGRFTMPFT